MEVHSCSRLPQRLPGTAKIVLTSTVTVRAASTSVRDGRVGGAGGKPIESDVFRNLLKPPLCFKVQESL
jgi:hypothetical protein